MTVPVSSEDKNNIDEIGTPKDELNQQNRPQNDENLVPPLSELKSTGDHSFESLFSFSSDKLGFDKICEEIIKDIRRKNIHDDQRPSFEQRTKNVSQLDKTEICQEYVAVINQKYREAVNNVLPKLDSKTWSQRSSVSNEVAKLELTMANTITTLNGIFKLPEKFKVIGLTETTGLIDETDSSPTYDDTNLDQIREEAHRSASARYRSRYFYIPTKEKPIGTVRSCVHDAISIALSRFNVLGINEKLYKQFPPFVSKDTDPFPLLESVIVSTYVSFIEINLLQSGIGGPLYWLLQEENLNSGVYLVFCKTSFHCKSKKQRIYQHHTIVYDSNYQTIWSNKLLQGALIDNRKSQHLIALEKHDWSNKNQCRRTLDKWFSGFGTKIRFLLKVIPKHPLRYFGDPDSSNQSNVVEFQKSMNPTEQFASLSNQNKAKKESNKTRKRNLDKRRKDKLKRIKKAQDMYHFLLK